MGLHSIDQGTLYWKCHKPKPECPATHTIHVNDDTVRWVSPTEVALPPCKGCGELRTLKVVFDEEEMQAENLVTYGMIPTEVEVAHPISGEILKGYIPALKPIGANPLHARNHEVAKQLKMFGKHPPEA